MFALVKNGMLKKGMSQGEIDGYVANVGELGNDNAWELPQYEDWFRNVVLNGKERGHVDCI